MPCWNDLNESMKSDALKLVAQLLISVRTNRLVGTRIRMQPTAAYAGAIWPKRFRQTTTRCTIRQCTSSPPTARPTSKSACGHDSLKRGLIGASESWPLDMGSRTFETQN